MKVLMTEPQQIPEILTRATRGDRAAFDQLVARSEERLRDFLSRRIRADLRDRLDVDSLTNDVFARAFESLTCFDGENEDAWFGWLAGIAKNVVLEEIARLTRRRALRMEREPVTEEPSPSRLLQREERFERLDDALHGLPEDHREVIRLCRLERLTIREVAERMNRSPGAVKMLLARALQELKGRFGDTESLGLPARLFRSDRERSEGGGDER